MNAVLAKNQAKIKQMRRHLAYSGSDPAQPGRIILVMRLWHLIRSDTSECRTLRFKRGAKRQRKRP